MNWTMRSIVLLIGLPMLGVCATAFYLLNKKEDDDLKEALESVKTSRLTTIEIKIPKANVGIIIGRAGSTIKEIQEKTGARINFRDIVKNTGAVGASRIEDIRLYSGGSIIKNPSEIASMFGEEHEDMRICVIRGTPSTAQEAECMIREIIMNQPLIEVYEMSVPQRACGRIIGRCGDNIRAISKASNAKISVDNSGDKSEDRKILIKGTIEQISLAKALIQEKVLEAEEVRQKMEISQANRSPRNKANSPAPASITASPAYAKNDFYDSGTLEPMLATGSDGFLQVFVSAVDSPSNFWVQVIGPRSTELDRLVDEMTAYYALEENKKLHEIKKLTIGQVVAAPFNFDTKWYRAEVKKIEINDYDPNESKIGLYYVDYGDSECRKQNELLQLRTDFLTLRFQAIECNLANVTPSGPGEKWSEAGIDCFEEICQVAQWRPLMARVVSVKEKQRGHREGSPVPCVELFDTSGTVDINIAEELVKQGFASYIEESKENKIVNGENKETTMYVNGANSDSTTKGLYLPAGDSGSEVDSDDLEFG